MTIHVLSLLCHFSRVTGTNVHKNEGQLHTLQRALSASDSVAGLCSLASSERNLGCQSPAGIWWRQQICQHLSMMDHQRMTCWFQAGFSLWIVDVGCLLKRTLTLSAHDHYIRRMWWNTCNMDRIKFSSGRSWPCEVYSRHQIQLSQTLDEDKSNRY